MKYLFVLMALATFIMYGCDDGSARFKQDENQVGKGSTSAQPTPTGHEKHWDPITQTMKD